MKILFVNTVCGIRSTGRIVTDLAQEFMAQGNEVRIAYGREKVPAQFQHLAYRIGTEMDVRFAALCARIFDNEGFNAIRQTKKFIKWAERYDPDLIWLHNLHGYYLNVEELFRWIKSRPHMQVRWTLHDCWAFTGHCTYFEMAGCSKWKEHCRNCVQLRQYPASICKDNSSKNFGRKREAFCGVKNMTLITPSHWLADLVRQSFLGEYQVEVVHNCIDMAVFKPTPGDFRRQNHLEDKHLVLGVASVWDNRKGYSDFLRLADLLDDSYAIVLVGLSAKQKKKRPAGIIGLGRTDSAKQLAQIYTAADVFVNLTYEDNYPTVNLEAQACGTPCLTYRTGGSVESVPPEHVVEQGDLEAMARKIHSICMKGPA